MDNPKRENSRRHFLKMAAFAAPAAVAVTVAPNARSRGRQNRRTEKPRIT